MIEITNILDTERYVADLDAIIFDLDDTLYSEKQYVRSGYHAIANAFPQIVDMEEKLWQVFERGGKAIDEVLEAEGQLEKKNEALHIYRYQKPEITFYPGVKELLFRLRESGKKIGIITDGRPEGQNAKIEALGLCSLVDEIIITDELGGIEFRKPCAKAFELMQKRMNISYEKMCYVGDNIKKDFVAPNRLGMQVFHYRNDDGLYN